MKRLPQIALLPDGKRLHLQDGPIDLVIAAKGGAAEVRAAYDAAARRFTGLLDELCEELTTLRQAADPGCGEGARWAAMRTHRIMTDKLAEFGASSKLNAEWEFLAMLKAEGRKSAGDFLTHHGTDLGNRSSADLDVLLAEC